MKLTLKEIAAAVDGQLSNLSLEKLRSDIQFQQVSTENLKLDEMIVQNIEFDSRLIGAGDIFLPLKGERDGHEFIRTAFDKGALVTFSEHSVDFPHILVADCQKALEKLAQYYLAKVAPKVIAITGSNGKTTTKDMTAAVLSEKYKCYKTQGNYNNAIGAPYTILHMPEDTELLVLEMGMDRPGEIDELSSLYKPDMGVITLIGESHLEFFGSRAAIAKGKMGITAGLGIENELLAPNDPIIDQFIPENQKITRFGDGAELHLSEFIEHKQGLQFQVSFLDETLSLPLPGKFNATNAMLAAYVGRQFSVSPQQIKHALAHVQLTKDRTEWKKSANGADILSDAYNANPTSMRLILETFQAIPSNPDGRKIAVLADMLELGPTAPELHAQIAESIRLDKIDSLYLYGPLMKNLASALAGKSEKFHFHYYADLSELTKDLKAEICPHDQILFKGSNGMKLSTVIEELEKQF